MKHENTIPIGGEVRPVHYGFAALSEWCELTGHGIDDLSNIGKNLTLQAAIQLIYCGLKHGARRKKIDFNFNPDDVADWIDDEGMDIFNDAMQIFSDSMSRITPEKKSKEKVKKK